MPTFILIIQRDEQEEESHGTPFCPIRQRLTVVQMAEKVNCGFDRRAWNNMLKMRKKKYKQKEKKQKKKRSPLIHNLNVRGQLFFQQIFSSSFYGTAVNETKT